MSKLIVTADIHGSYSSWLTIKALLSSNDKLVIAGDLFDTKYGNFSNADFQPESIKKDLKKIIIMSIMFMEIVMSHLFFLDMK